MDAYSFCDVFNKHHLGTLRCRRGGGIYAINRAVLDNLGSHKGPDIYTAIRAAKAHLLFLSPYSPGLNPIEQVFAKLKHMLYDASERIMHATWRRMGALLDRFVAKECANHLVNAGYAST
jgi:putative transposase